MENYESKILRFRALKESDAEQLFMIYSDSEAMKYRRNPPMVRIEDAQEFIANQITETEEYFKFRKGVELKPEQKLIGSVMYKYDKKTENECIIGYSIGRIYWGKGIGREIVRNLLESLRIQGNVQKVKAWIIKENLGSKRILEINEFQIEFQEEFPESYLYVKTI